MPSPIAICIEHLGSRTEGNRFVRCVATRGGEPGLGVNLRGDTVWKSSEALAFELWVSADDRLILLRPEGGCEVTVHRAGRSLDVPCSKPVVLVDRDEVRSKSTHVRVHVHGPTSVVHPPSPLGRVSSLIKLVAAASLVGAIGCKKDIEVRAQPPQVMPVPLPEPDASKMGGEREVLDASTESSSSSESTQATSPDAGPGEVDADSAKPQVPPIEVREAPPAPYE